jgi:prepilin-type N-terminal cleavage/methylation domain-containing protein/prepilin-type processing-associated H-X9-DG protein
MPASRRIGIVGRHVRKAFSLVELLVVIGIIGLLLALLMPTTAAVRARAQSLQCQAALRTMGVAAMLHANEHRGYLPLAGLHWRVELEPPGAAGFGDSEARKFTYYLDEGVERPVPFTVALAVQLGVRVRLDSRESLEDDMQTEAVRKYFRCPSQVVELKGLTQSIGPWQAPYEWSSYVFGEAVLGTRDKNWDFPRGKLTKVKRPSSVMLAMDGRPRQPVGTDKNWLMIPEFDTHCTLWDYKKLSLDPSVEWLGREGIDYLRHSWRANVLFVDCHVESVPLTDDGLRSVGTSKGIYD